VFVACWGVPGAAFCALAFGEGFVAGRPVAASWSWLDGQAGAVLIVAAVLCGLFWLSLPAALLVMGIGQVRAAGPAGPRWPVAWTAVLLAGIALDPLGLWALSTTSDGDGFQWAWLTAAIGYLAVSAALLALLTAAPRSSQSAAAEVAPPPGRRP